VKEHQQEVMMTVDVGEFRLSAARQISPAILLDASGGQSAIGFDELSVADFEFGNHISSHRVNSMNASDNDGYDKEMA
jgi:hypothetical protein